MIYEDILIFSSGALLIATFGMVITREFSGWINIYRYQTTILAVIAGIIGYITNNWEIYLAAIITFILKSIIVPKILMKVTNNVSSEFKNEIRPYISTKKSLGIATILVVLSYLLTQQIHLGSDIIAKIFLPLSISLFLIGLLVMIGRRISLGQIVGLLILENGLFLFTIALTHGVSLVIEIGIFIDVLVGIIILSILIHRIGYTFDSVDEIDLKHESIEDKEND